MLRYGYAITRRRQMTSTIETAGYIIANEQAIWGVGETPAAAWADFDRGMAANNIAVVDEAPEANETSWDPKPAVRREFYCEPATAGLLAEVKDAGGNRAWGYVGKVACTVAEEDGTE
jgi:hypothetical protein